MHKSFVQARDVKSTAGVTSRLGSQYYNTNTAYSHSSPSPLGGHRQVPQVDSNVMSYVYKHGLGGMMAGGGHVPRRSRRRDSNDSEDDADDSPDPQAILAQALSVAGDTKNVTWRIPTDSARARKRPKLPGQVEFDPFAPAEHLPYQDLHGDHPMTGMSQSGRNSAATTEDPLGPRGRKLAAQRRYRQKKKDELTHLRAIKKEYQSLQERMLFMKPYEIVAKVEQARMDAGKRPRQWCYVETWPECKIISEMRCCEALGYSLLGRHCWDYKRFPGISNNVLSRGKDAEVLKRHWAATVAKGGYSLYDFLDNQFFERLNYRGGKPVWHWCQVVAYRINDPCQKPALLQCLENDCHEAVKFGRRLGVTQYLKSVGSKHMFSYVINSGSYMYECYASPGHVQRAKSELMAQDAKKAQEAAHEYPAKPAPTDAPDDGGPGKIDADYADKVREAATQQLLQRKAMNSEIKLDDLIVVRTADAEATETLGWKMDGMTADDPSPGLGIPLLDYPRHEDNRFVEILRSGRTQEPIYYQRRKIVQKPRHKRKPPGQDPEEESEEIEEQLILVEAWAHMRSASGDGGVIIEVLERVALPPDLRKLATQ